jgi:hypothetical protein
VVQAETLKGADLRAVVTDRHKLIWDRGSDTLALYDLQSDPGEQDDVSMSQPEVLQALVPLTRRWGPARPSQPISLSTETEQRLRALGYIDP